MRIFISLLFAVSLIGCSQNPVSAPPNIPISQLLASPNTIVVDGAYLHLTTSMWRSFQPISPPDGTPLTAICYVEGTDTTRVPSTISADAVWIINDGQVWKSWFTDELPPTEEVPNRIVKYARNGPKWGPQINVDVIVRVTDGQGHSQLLRASDQYIARLD